MPYCKGLPVVSPLPPARLSFHLIDGFPTEKVQFSLRSRASPDDVSLDLIKILLESFTYCFTCVGMS